MKHHLSVRRREQRESMGTRDGKHGFKALPVDLPTVKSTGSEFPPCPGTIMNWRETEWSSGWRSCFVFGRYRVQISVRGPAISTEVHGFPQSLQTNTRLVSKIRPFPSKSFAIFHSLITLYSTLYNPSN